MTISKTEIIARALTKLGTSTVAGPVSGSVAYRAKDTASSVMEREYVPIVRRELQRQWKFARRRASLAADPVAPAFEWQYAYQEPADLLLLSSIENLGPRYKGGYPTSSGPKDYELEGNQILTNIAAPLKIKYIRDVSDRPDLWNEWFIEAVTLQLAVAASPTVNQENRQGAFFAYYNTVLARALQVNAIQEDHIELGSGELLGSSLGSYGSLL